MEETLIERVTRVYEAEQGSGRLARTLADIPITYEAITPEWLTAVTCGTVPRAAVDAFSLGPRDDGTSGRRRISIAYNEAGAAAGLPTSLFGKASQTLIQRIGYALNRSLHAEVNFYNNVRPLLDIECPRSPHAQYCDDSFNSIVLLDDMTGHAQFCDETSTITRSEAEEMVVTLADVHGPFYAPARFAAIAPGFDHFATRWAGYVADNGMQEYTNKGFLAAEAVIPRRLYARFDEVWPRTMDGVAAGAALPATFTHGDTHLSNWFKTTSGRVGLSDWQGCALDHWARDYMYAVSCALRPEDRRAWERDLLAIYLDRLGHHGVEHIDFDAAWLMIRRQTLSALAYWTVTYTPSPGMPQDMQPAERAREYIRRIAMAADDLESLDAFA